MKTFSRKIPNRNPRGGLPDDDTRNPRRWKILAISSEWGKVLLASETFRSAFQQITLREHLRPLFHLDRHKNFFICLRGNFMQFFNELLRPFPDCWRKHRVLLLRAPLDLRGRDLLLNQARYSIVISFMKISAQPLPSFLYGNVAENSAMLSSRRYHTD